MQIVYKKSVVLVLCVVFVTLLAGSVITYELTKVKQAEKTIEHLIEEQYEEAFEYVGYFDKYSDVSPTISYEKAEKAWVNRVKSLKQQGNFIQQAQLMHMRENDGFPTGMISITLMEDGKPKVVDSPVSFTRGFGKWLIVDFDDSQSKVLNAIGGDLREVQEITV